MHRQISIMGIVGVSALALKKLVVRSEHARQQWEHVGTSLFTKEPTKRQLKTLSTLSKTVESIRTGKIDHPIVFHMEYHDFWTAGPHHGNFDNSIFPYGYADFCFSCNLDPIIAECEVDLRRKRLETNIKIYRTQILICCRRLRFYKNHLLVVRRFVVDNTPTNANEGFLLPALRKGRK